MEIKIFESLNADAMMIRQAVFIDEQGFKEEWDDADKRALHIVMYDADEPIATCRIIPTDKEDTAILGRLAVMKKHRAGGVGSHLISLVCDLLITRGVRTIILHAQERALPFYEKNGFVTFGERDYDEDCPHRWMKRNIGN